MSFYRFDLEVHFSLNTNFVSLFKVHTITLLVSYLDDEEYKQRKDIVLKSKLRVRENNKILLTLISEKKKNTSILYRKSRKGCGNILTKLFLLLLQAFSGVDTNQLSLVTNQGFRAHS